MKKYLISLILLFLHITIFSQNIEHYLRITINDRSDLEIVTQMVSIDNVIGNEVVAYANDQQFEKLKTSQFKFIELEHPSVQAGRAITMATTVAQMAYWDRYPTYDVYNQLMVKFTEDYPNLCKLDTIGTSVLNRNILSLNITSDIENPQPKPEVLFSSTMHGDEVTGWILCLRLCDYLLSNYGSDTRITNMLDSISIFFAPNTNPDGTYYNSSAGTSITSARRNNANNQDLNRDFPDPRIGQNTPWQKETILMMDYATEHNFILGINYHGGAEVANYPWDTWTSSQKAHADNNWYIQISRKYADWAQANAPSWYFRDLNNGITNGGNWYVITGGRQDYVNYWQNCREITLEVSSTKMPQSENLPNYWNWNSEAMLTFIENVKYGIRGIVSNEENEPIDAKITVIGHDTDNSFVVTNPQFGNYYRMIQNGTYNLLFEAYGYDSQTISGVSAQQNNATILDVTMQKSLSYTVSGVIVNSHTGFPEENVKIEIKNAPISPIFSDASGSFSMDIITGQHQLVFSKTGFLPTEKSILINDDIDDMLIVMQVFEGIDFEDGTVPAGFTFSGNQNWFITNTQTYEGSYSIRSGVISHNQSSTMSYSFNAPTAGQVSFYAKVSSESGYDFLRFYIDNVQQGQWSGEVDWTEFTYSITAGNHTLSWTYIKDGSVSNGADAAFVDLISTPKINQNAVPYINPRIVDIETEENVGQTYITMWNIGSSNLNYSATIENQENNMWLSLSNGAGTIASNQNTEITLSYNFNTLPSGLYNTNLLIDVVDSIIIVPVSINFTEEFDDFLYLTPSSIDIEIDEISGEFTITMLNIGNDDFDFIANISSYNTPFQLTSNNSGTLEPQQEIEFNISFNFELFEYDIYTSTLDISVTILIENIPYTEVFSVPISINYIETPKGIPQVTPQIIEIETDEVTGDFIITMQNIGNAPFTFTTSIPEQTENWLLFDEETGILEPEQQTQFVLLYDFNSFDYGIYYATLNIDVIDSIIIVPITITYVETPKGIPQVTPQSIEIETEEVTGDFIITMQNIGNAPFDYNADIEPEQAGDWLSLFYDGNLLEPEHLTDFILNFDFTSLDAKITYTAYLKIDVKDSIISIPININYLIDVLSSNINHFTIYPNPTSDIFTLLIPNLDDIAIIEIYTPLGHKIYQGRINDKRQTFSLWDLGIKNNGIYILKIETQNFIGTAKIVRQN